MGISELTGPGPIVILARAGLPVISRALLPWSLSAKAGCRSSPWALIGAGRLWHHPAPSSFKTARSHYVLLPAAGSWWRVARYLPTSRHIHQQHCAPPVWRVRQALGSIRYWPRSGCQPVPILPAALAWSCLAWSAVATSHSLSRLTTVVTFPHPPTETRPIPQSGQQPARSDCTPPHNIASGVQASGSRHRRAGSRPSSARRTSSRRQATTNASSTCAPSLNPPPPWSISPPPYPRLLSSHPRALLLYPHARTRTHTHDTSFILAPISISPGSVALFSGSASRCLHFISF